MRKTIYKNNKKILSNDRKKKGLSKDYSVKVITLSGVNTIGRNSYVIEIENELLVVDFGIGFPDNGAFNINGILPDIDWLIKNKKRIKGIVITHAHMDHVGGIPYILDKLDYPPIYGSNFAIEFLKEKLKEFKKHNQAKFNKVISGDKVKISSKFTVEFAHVTHSIPQCFAVAINTKLGKVVYTGDFKFDDTPINDRPTDTHILKRWAKEGILVSLLDSTNVYEQGHSESETTIVGVLEKIVREAQGRVIIGMFSSLVSRLVGVMEIAEKLNKKVAFTGRSMETNVKIAVRIGYLMPKKGTIIPIKDIDKYPDNQVIVMTTGSQGEHMAALTRMARNQHTHVKLKKTDTIVMSSSVIPTNVVPVQDLMDKLSRTGATVINSKLMDVHVSGHAYQEELKEMALLLESKYYLPVHGYTSFLFQHRLILGEAGIPMNRVIIPTEGSITRFSNKGFLAEKKLKVRPIFLLDKELLDPTDTLVDDREKLAGAGHVLICIDKNKNVHITAKGVVSKNKLDSLLESLESITKNVLNEAPPAKVKRIIYAKVGAFIKRKYGATPVVTLDIEK